VDFTSFDAVSTQIASSGAAHDEFECFDAHHKHGTTLATWPGQIAIPAGAYSDANVTVTNNDPGLDDVTVSIPIGTDEKKFARLRADIPFTP
jgi:hypothetical protein